MAGFELQISIVLLCALAGYLISYKINQSAVVGVIIIGVVIGPSVLGIVRYTEAVKMLAHLGAIMLLFSVGLEFEIRNIYRGKYFIIALVGLLLPWVAGYLIGLFFGRGSIEAMFMGVSLSATSIAITAKVLDEMKKLHTEAARAIIGAAVIDDVLGLLALAIVVQTADGTVSAIRLLPLALKAAGFMAVGILTAPVIRRLFTRLDDAGIAGRYPDFLFIMAVMFCFLYSSIAEILGLSAIVGSFLAGAALEGAKFRRSRGLKEGAEYFHMLFGAIFFISLGILVDLRELTVSVVPLLTVLLFVSVLTKLVGCGAASRLLGYNRQESLIIGFGMVPRGEVAMIVALIGLTSGVIGQDIYVAVVVMSLMTTILTPLFLRRLRWRSGEEA